MEQKWIPVSERLPEDNIIRVWLSFTNQYASYVKSAFWNGSYFEHANGKKVKDKPTAWKSIVHRSRTATGRSRPTLTGSGA